MCISSGSSSASEPSSLEFCFRWIFDLTFCTLLLFSSSSTCFFSLIKKPTPQPRSSIVSKRRDEFLRPTVCTLVWSMNSSGGEMISLSVAFAMKHTYTQTRTAESNRTLACFPACWLASWLACLFVCLFACAQPKLDRSFTYYCSFSLSHSLSSAPYRNPLFQSRNYCAYVHRTHTRAQQRAIRFTLEHSTQISRTHYVNLHYI